jgi:hypothetical protein
MISPKTIWENIGGCFFYSKQLLNLAKLENKFSFKPFRITCARSVCSCGDWRITTFFDVFDLFCFQ